MDLLQNETTESQTEKLQSLLSLSLREKGEPILKLCQHCHKKPAKSENGKYCSTECYHLNRSVLRRCLNCRKAFRCPRSATDRGWGKYCSRKCHYARRNRESRTPADCLGCGKKFLVYKKWEERTKFCSRRCRRKYYALRERTCVHCKRVFYVRRHTVEKEGGKFCTLKCRSQFASASSKARLQKTSRPCRECGKPVQRYPSQFRQGKGRFCSRKCYALYRSMAGRICRTCPQCNKPFSFPKNRMRWRPPKYCSKECAHEALRNHEMRPCFICGRPFKCIPARAAQSAKYCSVDCAYLARKWTQRQAALKFMIYTPEILCMMASVSDETCSFPGCEAPRSVYRNRYHVWNACRYHRQRIGQALRERRRRREAILSSFNLTVEKEEHNGIYSRSMESTADQTH